MSERQANSILEPIRRSPLVRVLLLGFLVLLLQIAIFMIRDVIRERESTRNQAIQDVTSKWGGQQSLIGPRLVIPYVKRTVEVTDGGTQKIRAVLQYAHFLPDTLHVKGQIDSQVRYRGIFQVPLYSLD